ncbi:hypothetical protein E4U17_001432 [Claviceps sp. LM77 group G4]|nr:hypothetical protein E4U17_001432 [Claviceps sp. LM77 group G4]
MAITTEEVPVVAHHSIGKTERYHIPLRGVTRSSPASRRYSARQRKITMPGKSFDLFDQAEIKALLASLMTCRRVATLCVTEALGGESSVSLG